jgi:hypothetical protein
MTTRYLAAGLAALIAMAAMPVLSCEGTSTLFEDDFSFADPAWGNYDGTSIADGAMTISVDPGGGYTLLNQASLYTDFDACIDVVQRNDDPDGGWGSLVFWGVDYDNFYTLDVTTSGYVKISRLQNNKWLSPVDWTLTEGVVNSGTSVNSLRVVVRGNVAIAYVNGQQVAQFRGQPPADGGLIGIYGAAPCESSANIDFDNFVISAADADPSSSSGGPAQPGEGTVTLGPGFKEKQL